MLFTLRICVWTILYAIVWILFVWITFSPSCIRWTLLLFQSTRIGVTEHFYPIKRFSSNRKKLHRSKNSFIAMLTFIYSKICTSSFKCRFSSLISTLMTSVSSNPSLFHIDFAFSLSTNSFIKVKDSNTLIGMTCECGTYGPHTSPTWIFYKY